MSVFSSRDQQRASEAVNRAIGGDSLDHWNERQTLAERAEPLVRAARSAIANRLAVGAEKRPDGDDWPRVSQRDHVLAIMRHGIAYLSGDRSEDHIAAMISRGSMAACVEEKTDVR